MMEENNLLRQLFQDQPIDQSALKRMQMNIRDFALANPIDFRQKIDLQKRRQWGIAVAAMLFIVGLIISALLWFLGDQLIWLFRQLVIGGAPFVPIPWLTGLWQGIYERVEVFWVLLPSFKLLWQNYSAVVMVLLGIWVLHRGLDDKGHSTE